MGIFKRKEKFNPQLNYLPPSLTLQIQLNIKEQKKILEDIKGIINKIKEIEK